MVQLWPIIKSSTLTLLPVLIIVIKEKQFVRIDNEVSEVTTRFFFYATLHNHCSCYDLTTFIIEFDEKFSQRIIFSHEK